MVVTYRYFRPLNLVLKAFLELSGIHGLTDSKFDLQMHSCPKLESVIAVP